MSNIDEQVEQLKVSPELQGMLGEIEMGVMTRFTLADAIRLGATVSDQAYDWTDSAGNMCALSSAVVAAKGLGYIK